MQAGTSLATAGSFGGVGIVAAWRTAAPAGAPATPTASSDAAKAAPSEAASNLLGRVRICVMVPPTCQIDGQSIASHRRWLRSWSYGLHGIVTTRGRSAPGAPEVVGIADGDKAEPLRRGGLRRAGAVAAAQQGHDVARTDPPRPRPRRARRRPSAPSGGRTPSPRSRSAAGPRPHPSSRASSTRRVSGPDGRSGGRRQKAAKSCSPTSGSVAEAQHGEVDGPPDVPDVAAAQRVAPADLEVVAVPARRAPSAGRRSRRAR